MPKSWLNTLYLSMDANFKLKQKERGFTDPPLSNGLVFMVANERLRDHLADCSKTKQIAEVSVFNRDGSYHLLNSSIRSTHAVLHSMRSPRLTRSTPRGMRLLALVGLIARGMVSSDQMALSTYSEANSKSSCFVFLRS